MPDVKVVKLRGSRAYLEWMRAHSGAVRVTHVESQDQRGIFSLGEKDYTVTYTILAPADQADG